MALDMPITPVYDVENLGNYLLTFGMTTYGRKHPPRFVKAAMFHIGYERFLMPNEFIELVSTENEPPGTIHTVKVDGRQVRIMPWYDSFPTQSGRDLYLVHRMAIEAEPDDEEIKRKLVRALRYQFTERPLGELITSAEHLLSEKGVIVPPEHTEALRALEEQLRV